MFKKIDNFLEFPAGTAVPVGYYDKDEDKWEAADSGVVIDIVDIAGDKAVVDVDGDGKGDSDELLGKQEVVIKNLGDMFRNVRGVAGGAILGDGRIGLILDTGGLLSLIDQYAPRAAA